MDFINDILNAGSWISSDDTRVEKEYWSLPEYHCKRILQGACVLDSLELSPPLLSIECYPKKGRLILTHQRVKPRGTLGQEDKKSLLSCAISKLHDAGWAHGNIAESIIYDDKRIYIVDPDTIFEISKNTSDSEPESWLIEWIKKGHDLTTVEELIELDKPSNIEDIISV